MKALVCIVGNNQLALREMERMGGFQVGHKVTPFCMLFDSQRTVVPDM